MQRHCSEKKGTEYLKYLVVLQRAGYAPGPRLAPADEGTEARRVQRVPCTVNSLLACIYSAMYSVINQYCLNRCPYCMSTVSDFERLEYRSY
jgi:hypothetical protein